MELLETNYSGGIVSEDLDAAALPWQVPALLLLTTGDIK